MHFPVPFLVNPVMLLLHVRQLFSLRQVEQEISQAAQNFEEEL